METRPLAAPAARPEALARLAVGTGANMQPGQVLAVNARPGQEELVRAIADAAYRAGARFVDVGWSDPYVKLARCATPRTTRSTGCPRGTGSGSCSWARWPPRSWR